MMGIEVPDHFTEEQCEQGMTACTQALCLLIGSVIAVVLVLGVLGTINYFLP